MAAAMRRAVTSVTDYVFPAPKARDIQQHKLINRGQEYVSNLPLQMMLYFNVFFTPIWLISSIVTLELKYSSLSILYQIIIIAILIVMTVVELIRLYLGYVGNLTEKVPELAGFWLLTLLLQLPLSLFLLLNEDTLILPLERAMNAIMFIFIGLEVIVGYLGIRTMVNYQVTKFHLQQFTDFHMIQDLPVPGTPELKSPRYTA